MIKLFKNYVIDADNHQYILGTLEQRKSIKDKNVMEDWIKPIGYYTKLSSALDGACKIKCRKTIAESDISLIEAIKEINKMHNDFMAMLDNNINEELYI